MNLDKDPLESKTTIPMQQKYLKSLSFKHEKNPKLKKPQRYIPVK